VVTTAIIVQVPPLHHERQRRVREAAGEPGAPGCWRGQRIALPLVEASSRPWIAIIGDDNNTADGPSAYDRDGLRRLAALARGLVVDSGAAAVQHCAAS
jgi:hypothetical protein